MEVIINKAHHPLYYDLAGVVGPEYVTDDDFALETYSKDTSPLPPNKQGIVVRPVNTDQVVDIVNLANTAKIPIVISGGRASFYGTPKGLHGKGIVVDMTRMKKMINIDEGNLCATAEAGMTTAEFTTHVWDAGWDVHTAFMPWYPDTLGGQISGFAGGGNGMEMASAGFNATHIAGVKVVLGNGSVVQTGSGAGSNIHCKQVYDRYPGNPDLTGIFMGAAGTFGIITEATYRMYKFTPLRKCTNAYWFDTFEDAWEMVQEVSTVEPLPYYHMNIIPPTEMTAKKGLSKYLTIPIAKGNTEKELEAKLEIIEEIIAKYPKAEVAHGEQVEEWREAAVTGKRHREMGEFATPGVWTFFEYYCSRSQVVECHHTMRNFIYARLKEKNIPHLSNEGCIPSGAPSWILTTVIFTKGEDKRVQQEMQKLFAEAAELACSKGYYPDCHQGYGTRMMAKNWPKAHYQFMKTLKGAMDPNNIMNPGVWDL